jgi:hypothetical protein
MNAYDVRIYSTLKFLAQGNRVVMLGNQNRHASIVNDRMN